MVDAERLMNQIVQFPGCRASFCRTFKTKFSPSSLTLWFVSTCAGPHDTQNLTFRLSLANGLEQHHTPRGDTASPRVAGMWELCSGNVSCSVQCLPTLRDVPPHALEEPRLRLTSHTQSQGQCSHMSPAGDVAFG